MKPSVFTAAIAGAMLMNLIRGTEWGPTTVFTTVALLVMGIATVIISIMEDESK